MPDIIITPNDGTIEFKPSSSTVNKIEASGNTFNLINTSSSNETIFNIEGTNGSLFSVADDLSGTLMSVNNNAGLPVFEVFNDDSIVAGRFNQNDFVLNSSGNIGIGTDSPTVKLHVNGNVKLEGWIEVPNIGQIMPGTVTGFIVTDGDFLGATDSIIDYFGDIGIGTGATAPTARLNVEGGNVIFNDLGGNFDFRVEGDTNQNLLFTDASTDRVGIGTNTPASTLHVVGEIRVASGNIVPATDNTGAIGTAALTWNNGQFTNLTIDSTLTVTSTLNVRAAIDLADNDILRFGDADDWEMYHNGTNNVIDLTVGDLLIRDDATTGDPTRFHFQRSGNLGIGVSPPTATLHVVGGASTPIQVGDLNDSQPFFAVRAGSAFISAVFGRSSAQANCRIQYYSGPLSSGNYWIQDASETSFSLTRSVANVNDVTVFKLENGKATFNNAFTLPNTDGSSGQTLVTNGSGVVSWTSLTNITRGSFNLSANQSVFTVNDGYIVGGLDVYYNGIKLLSGTDYTATNGTSFTLTNVATSGDVVEYVALSAASMDANTVRGSVAATNDQTVFSVSGGYTVGNLDVFLNGIKLVSGTDYTATNGTSITLTAAASSGDVLEYNAYGLVVASNGLQKTGDTMTGNLTIGSGSDIRFDDTIIDNNSLDISIANGRLTLESGVSVSTTDQTAKTTLYYTPYNGNRIALYDTNLSKWKMHSFSELSLSLSGLAASTVFDIFIYDNNGTLTLESVVWSSSTARVTELAQQDGVYVRNGSINKRYIGTIRTINTAGQCEDSLTKRFVWNLYNSIDREIRNETTANWTYATNTWRALNNTNYNLELICGIAGNNINLTAGVLYTMNATTITYYAIGIANQNSATPSFSSRMSSNWTGAHLQIFAHGTFTSTNGYQYFYPVENRVTGGTPAIYGSSNTGHFGGIMGTWRC
jgi:hypothetical protein